MSAGRSQRASVIIVDKLVLWTLVALGLLWLAVVPIYALRQAARRGESWFHYGHALATWGRVGSPSAPFGWDAGLEG